MPHPEWPAEPSPWDPDRAAEPSSLWDPNSPHPAPPVPGQVDAAARNAAAGSKAPDDGASANGSGPAAGERDGGPSPIRPYVLSGADDTTLTDAPTADASTDETRPEAATTAGDATTAEAAPEAEEAPVEPGSETTEPPAAAEPAAAETATTEPPANDPATAEPVGSDVPTTPLAPAGAGDAKPVDTGDAKPVDTGDAKPADARDAKPVDARDAKPVDGESGRKPGKLKPPAGYIPHGSYPPAPEKRGRGLIIALTIVIVLLMLTTAGVAYLLQAKSSAYDRQVAAIGQRNTTIAANRTKLNQLNTQLQAATAQVQQLQQQLSTQASQLTAAQAQVASLQQCIHSFNNLLSLVAQNASKTDINTAAKQIDATCGSNLPG